MEDYEVKLRKAAKEQMYASFYDVHILSPLLDPSLPPIRSKEDVKKSESVSVRLPSWVKNELFEIAEFQEISVTQLINNAIINSLMKHHDQEKARQIYLEFMHKWKIESPQIEPLKMSDIHRMSNSINPLREALTRDTSNPLRDALTRDTK